MILKKCVNGTEDCTKWGEEDLMSILEKEEALEEVVWNGLKMWHLIFLSIAGVSCVIILFCCCVKFRIPRTKQEIEADYIRRQILRKFRKRLKAIQNQELDEMDLKKALDKIRAEFKSDTESLAQSEAGFSAATISSNVPPRHGSTYRRASQIQIDISLDDLRAHTLGPRARFALALSRLCGRSKGSKSDKVALTVDAEGEAHLSVPEGAFKGKDKATPAPEQSKKSKVDGKKDKETKSEGQTSAKASTAPTPGPTDKKSKSKDNSEKKAKQESEDKKKKSKSDDKEAAADKKKDKEVAKKDTEKKAKDAKAKPKEESLKPDPNKKTMEVKGQAEPGPSTPTPLPPPQTSEDKKKSDDKKQKEKEEKDRKKAEKEKERLEKEKAKAEKTKLKIENEKVQKAAKEKAKEDKKKEKVAGKENKPEKAK